MMIKALTDSEFEAFFNVLMPEAFAERLSYSVMDVRTETEIANFPSLKKAFAGKSVLHFGAFDENGKIMGWSSSYQSRLYELYTKNSVVLPEYRRKGVYTALTQKVIETAEKMGFQSVVSSHNVSNNAVIMAKLKLGFYITGLEICDDYGTLVKLTRYVNPVRNKVFHFRSGHERPDHEVREVLKLP